MQFEFAESEFDIKLCILDIIYIFEWITIRNSDLFMLMLFYLKITKRCSF